MSTSTITIYTHFTMGDSPNQVSCQLQPVQKGNRYTFTGTCVRDEANKFDIELSFALNNEKQTPSLNGNYIIRRNENQDEGGLTGIFTGNCWSLQPAGFENDETWVLKRPES